MNYICEDCVYIFQVYTIGKSGKRLFCPYCGENTGVRNYRSERYTDTHVKIRWTEEELLYIQQVNDGKMKPFQAAYTIGRSINAVVKKAARMREQNGKKE